MAEVEAADERFEEYLKEQEKVLQELKNTAESRISRPNHAEESQFTTSPLHKYNHRLSEYKKEGEAIDAQITDISTLSQRIVRWTIYVVIIIILVTAGYYCYDKFIR